MKTSDVVAARAIGAIICRYRHASSRFFPSHPTLEPAITAGNEQAVAEGLACVEMAPPPSISPQTIHDLFRTVRKSADVDNALPVYAGTGASRKAEFAMALADILGERLNGAGW